MRLIMVRHGETLENIAKIMQGHLPGKLSSQGKEQARKVAHRLKDEHVEYIFSSDAARAYDTAIEIAKYHPRALLEATEELRERYLGDLQGKVKPEEFVAGRWDVDYAIKHGLELPQELFERSRNFLERTAREYNGKNVLTTSHNGLYQGFHTYLSGRPWQNIGQAESFGNTSVTVVEFDGGKPQIKLLNCTKHLGESFT